MNNEDYMIDKYYDSLYSKYEEEATVRAEDYYRLKDDYDELYYQLQDILYFIKQNDPAGAYEYAKSEGLV